MAKIKEHTHKFVKVVVKGPKKSKMVTTICKCKEVDLFQQYDYEGTEVIRIGHMEGGF